MRASVHHELFLPGRLRNQKPMNDLVTTQDFIDFYSAIPEDKWCTDTNTVEGRRCAYGHLYLGQEELKNRETIRAADRLTDHFIKIACLVSEVNDGGEVRFPQPTPKQRILAALKEIQETNP